MNSCNGNDKLEQDVPPFCLETLRLRWGSYAVGGCNEDCFRLDILSLLRCVCVAVVVMRFWRGCVFPAPQHVSVSGLDEPVMTFCRPVKDG